MGHGNKAYNILIRMHTPDLPHWLSSLPKLVAVSALFFSLRVWQLESPHCPPCQPCPVLLLQAALKNARYEQDLLKLSKVLTRSPIDGSVKCGKA